MQRFPVHDAATRGPGGAIHFSKLKTGLEMQACRARRKPSHTSPLPHGYVGAAGLELTPYSRDIIE